MAPITRPFTTIGTAPWLARSWPGTALPTWAQNGEPFWTRSARSAVDMRKFAAAIALAREVSGVKKPVPSPREHSTSRPASSTTVIVIGVPRALAFSRAARDARSAISSVSSIMPATFLEAPSGIPAIAPALKPGCPALSTAPGAALDTFGPGGDKSGGREARHTGNDYRWGTARLRIVWKVLERTALGILCSRVARRGTGLAALVPGHAGLDQRAHERRQPELGRNTDRAFRIRHATGSAAGGGFGPRDGRLRHAVRRAPPIRTIPSPPRSPPTSRRPARWWSPVRASRPWPRRWRSGRPPSS